jgi:hypothetical protein
MLASQVGYGQAPENQHAASGPATRAVGTVKAVSGNVITVSTDSGAEMKVTVPPETRILRTAPGRKDLTDATSTEITDVQAGDRILVRVQPGGESNSVMAASIVLMKRADIASAQESERQDWQRRGVGGLVAKVDPAAATITISNLGAAGKTNTLIHVGKNAIIRRYAPNSIQFDDAKPGTFSDIKSGDQLRARGTRNPDGTELTAEEIVSGTFRNIAGTVNSTDAGAKTINVTDLTTKKPVAIKLAPDSQLRKLPPMLARGIAMRLHPGTSGTPGGNGGPPPPGAGTVPTRGPGGTEGPFRGGMQGGGPGGPRPGGDFQQMLARMPGIAIADLQKGDAVMIVATEGSADSPPTVITLLAGVEPILTAAPNGGGAMLLSQWTLGTSMPDVGP